MKDLDLIIPVDEIPDGGRVIEGELSSEWMKDSLLEAYTPSSPVRVSLTAQRFSKNVHVSGDLKIRLAFVCGRTLVPGEIELAVRIGELFQPEGSHATKLGDGIDVDAIEDQPYTYSGRRIDLAPFLREELVLAQDPYPVVDTQQKAGDDQPAWSSSAGEVDPRWAKLKDLDLN